MKQLTHKMKYVAVLSVLGSAFAAPVMQAMPRDRDADAVAERHRENPLSAEDPTVQTDDHLFDAVDKLGAKAKESNEVNLDKSMLGLAARKGGDKGELAQKLDFIVVRDYEFAHENDYNMDDLKPIFKKLEDGGWKHLVRTREAKEMTDICVKQDAEGATREMVIISAEPKELSLVHLKGNVNLNDMKNFGSLMRGETKGDPTKEDPKLNRH